MKMANKVVKNTNPRKNKGNFKPLKKNSVVKKSKFRNGKLQDARQKIISKKRQGVKDARDILAKMAKTQDARNKLDKIRESRDGGLVRNNVKVIGNNILRKTDRNGKISLSTNKSNATSNIKMAIERELGLVPPPRVNLRRNLSQNVKRILPSIPPLPTIPRKQSISPYQYEAVYEDMPPHPSLYKWTNPAASQLINTVERPLRRSNMNRNFENFSISRPLGPRPTYIDLDAVEDEIMPLEIPALRQSVHLHGTGRSSNIHSRLDSNLPQPESHGIFAATKTKVVVPAGHRIVVSNLQNTVSQEDIKELFEDVGDLLAARLVRPGVAEVIYKNLKDAQKAVDTYHNRQLDGQPMKCLLVNKRPLNNPTAPALPKGDMNYTEIPRTIPEKLVPDISTIHKVLFQRKY